ncbi:hypothetical protein ACIGXF_16350 [Streptomyces sp. NPDC053086]
MSLPPSRLAEAADQLTEQLARLGTPSAPPGTVTTPSSAPPTS